MCSLEVSMTLIMRVKFTGLPDMEKVMDFCKGENGSHDEIYGKNRFKVRANETEGEIISESECRSGKFNVAKSGDYAKFYDKSVKGDML